MERETRRLAVVAAADVAGYSRLMGKDEEGTITSLRNHRRDLIDELIAEYGGRIANTAGDSLLIEFKSAVDALRCALSVQEGMSARNEYITSDNQIRFRIGINIGDVIAEGEDLLGDGVNIAARIQENADPGGICISNSVYEQVAGKLDQSFDDLGHCKLKNISNSVHIFRVRLGDSPPVSSGGWFERPPTEKSLLITGRCMCGRISYAADPPTIDIGLCHCRMCQKFNSAPFSYWVVFPAEAVHFPDHEPKYYSSSLIAERGFCADCGTSLTMRYKDPKPREILAILASTLDHPEDFPPSRHYCIEGKIPWLDMNDNLPRGNSWDSEILRRRWASVGLPDPADWK